MDLIGFNLLVQLKGWLWWGVDENSNSSRELDIENCFHSVNTKVFADCSFSNDTF